MLYYAAAVWLLFCSAIDLSRWICINIVQKKKLHRKYPIQTHSNLLQNCLESFEQKPKPHQYLEMRQFNQNWSPPTLAQLILPQNANNMHNYTLKFIKLNEYFGLERKGEEGLRIVVIKLLLWNGEKSFIGSK